MVRLSCTNPEDVKEWAARVAAKAVAVQDAVRDLEAVLAEGVTVNITADR